MNEVKKEKWKTKSIFYFAIAPEFRGNGIAKMLLTRVCEDAEKEGFDFVEAYPNITFIDTEQDFMGPVQLFKKLGFIDCYTTSDKIVVRKKVSSSSNLACQSK